MVRIVSVSSPSPLDATLSPRRPWRASSGAPLGALPSLFFVPRPEARADSAPSRRSHLSAEPNAGRRRRANRASVRGNRSRVSLRPRIARGRPRATSRVAARRVAASRASDVFHRGARRVPHVSTLARRDWSVRQFARPDRGPTPTRPRGSSRVAPPARERDPRTPRPDPTHTPSPPRTLPYNPI